MITPQCVTRMSVGLPAGTLSLLVFAAAAALGGCRGDAPAPASPTEPDAEEAAAAAPLAFRQLSSGGKHTCGVTTDNRAYCWGNNVEGELGIGTTTGPENCIFPEGDCSTRPVAVAGGLRFRQVSAGGYHTCGVSTDNRAFCWGWAGYGRLGDGTDESVSRPAPVPVVGGLQFRQVSAGGFHTCGVTTDDRAHCWGFNLLGQLGNGTTSGPEGPGPVAGGLRFREVSANGGHNTCGITTARRVYCWGAAGLIGDSAQEQRLTPVRVAGGRFYRSLDLGLRHACAVTYNSSLAFCWGEGRQGQLGTGGTYVSFWPRRVAGGLSFRHVGTGSTHSCGQTTDNRTWCWGDNILGQLGDGTTTQRLTPTAVAGSLTFTQVLAGGRHSCGLTAAGAAYCWGRNASGELGDGTMSRRLTPTAVVGPL